MITASEASSAETETWCPYFMHLTATPFQRDLTRVASVTGVDVPSLGKEPFRDTSPLADLTA